MKAATRLYHLIEQNPQKAFGFTCLFLIAYQLISAFIGFELCDSGFYMTFYDNIFTAPECVEYNFMYYLSGVVGGAYMTLFPDAGIFDMRILGIANNMLIVYLLYLLFRKHISMSAIITGCVLVIISYVTLPMTFYNDLLTSLLFVVALFYLLRGLEKSNNLYFIISGIAVALNTFARVPNVLDYGLILLIMIHAVYYRDTTRTCIRRCLIFTISFILGIAGILVFMKAVGHYELFIHNLQDLSRIAEDDSGTSSHTLKNMALVQIKNYYIVFKFGIKLLLLYAVLLLSTKYIKNSFINVPLRIVAYALLAMLFYKTNAVITLCAFSVTGLLGNILLEKDKSVKMLSWAGLSMILIFPIGSDGGMFNNGSIIFWMGMPMAVSFYISIKDNFLQVLSLPTDKQILLYSLGIYILVCGVKTIKDGVYFDGGWLFEKRYTIQNDRVKHIYTTQEKAEVMNDLLKGIKPYIKEGDYLFAYGSLPAIHYMTRTRPIMGCSWPELLGAPLLRHKLSNYNGPLPPVLRQKFNSIGLEFGEPSEDYLIDCGVEKGPFRSNRKSEIINEFTEKNHYKVAFENRYFVLLLPQQ